MACAALGSAFTLSVLSVVVTAWGQPPSPTPGAPAPKGATPGSGNVRNAQDGLEVSEVQLEAKRALVRIDESRVEQAKRWRAYYERQVREGRVTEDRLIAARDDVLMMEAHVEAERAGLKVAEMRLRNARRRAAHSSQAESSADQAREDLEALEALLRSKQALLRVGESRSEQAKRAEARYEREFRAGLATEDLVLAAHDNVLLMDTMLAWGRADLKVAELRVENARQVAAHVGPSGDGTVRRLAELEERVIEAEMKADVLQHEVGRLRRELPRETRGAR
jgi:hypothetical protein